MNILLILWHTWLKSIDEAELSARIIDNSASDKWAVSVISCVIWREQRIEELRKQTSPRLLAMLDAVVEP